MIRFLLFLTLIQVATACGGSLRPQQNLSSSMAAEESDDHSVFDLSHPEKDTARSTRTLIASHEQPSPENIAACQEKLKEIEQKANLDYEIVSAKKALVPEITKDRPTYHWCFYQSVSQLDEWLEKEGVPLEKRSQHFYETMKGLWPLARALDYTNVEEDGRSSDYFDYLRARYLQISKEYFGRNLEVIGDPVDQGPMRISH